MAYVKIHPIKSTMTKAIKYISNPTKTDYKSLVSAYAIEPEMASLEFETTRIHAAQSLGTSTKERPGNLGYHLIQSFSPEDNLTPDLAHQIGKELADAYLQGKYEYIISTHVDKAYIHNHIIINATSFLDFHKLETVPYKTIKELRSISDSLCRKHGLSVISEPNFDAKKSKFASASFKAQLRVIIDNAISKASTYEDFVAALSAEGVHIKEGKHIAFKMRNQQHYTRGKTIGEPYTKDSILSRISSKCLYKKSAPSITPSKKFYDEVYWRARKEKLANTKELAQLLKCIRTENITSMSDFKLRIATLENQIKDLNYTLSDLQTKSTRYTKVLNCLTIINSNQAIYDQWLTLPQSPSKDKFYIKNQATIDAYTLASKQLDKYHVVKTVEPEKLFQLIENYNKKVDIYSSKLTSIHEKLSNIKNANNLIASKLNTPSHTI